MASKDIGSMLIVNDKGWPVGISTGRGEGLDPPTTLPRGCYDSKIRSRSIRRAPFGEAARIMEGMRVCHLPVTEREGRLAGIADTMRDPGGGATLDSLSYPKHDIFGGDSYDWVSR